MISAVFLRIARAAAVGCVCWLLACPAFAQVSYLVGSPAEVAAEKRIMRALEQPVSVLPIEARLGEVVAILSRQSGLDIRIDRRALDDVGLTTDTPVTFRSDDLPLWAALDLLLQPVELEWTIRHQVLIISTPEEVESNLMTRVYPVGDLVWTDHGDEILEDYDSLIHAITATIAPDTWSSVGGPGSIEQFGPTKSLTVSQTIKIHAKVENMLLSLRQARRAQGIEPILPEPRPIAMFSAEPARSGPATTAPTTTRHMSAAQRWQMPRMHD